MISTYRIGIVGSGFITKGLIFALEQHQELTVSKVLTRTTPDKRTDFPGQNLLTNSIDELIHNSDLVVECSGEIIHGTEVIKQVMSASLPVVTLDSELQVTTGSYFARKGFITEAEGDQPGCLAALGEEATQMGFRPIVYGNIKGFLNTNPTREEMEFWAKKQELRIDKVISFTDGTKVQFEQALVANGLSAKIAAEGLLGINSDDVETGASILANHAEDLGFPISDYILSSKSPPGVFIVSKCDERQRTSLRNVKMGDGPNYTLIRPFHLCHLEIAKTIKRVLRGDKVLLNNGENPTIGIAAITKRSLAPGYKIHRGIGNFDVRGSAVTIADAPGHVPIGLLDNAVVTKHIERGKRLNFDDVDLPDSLALRIWNEIVRESYPGS
ncbi:NAD(P)-dependent oxidoreductase [Chloroflexota bacterium]